MNALYIGAGIDVKPIKYFDKIKTFNYIDSQPYSEFGLIECIDENGINLYSRPNFIDNFNSEISKIRFSFINTINNKIIYSNRRQVVNYYINIAIPELYNDVKTNIKNFDTLIVAGHDPDSIILNATNNKIHFIGFEDTYYGKEDIPENPNSIVNRLNNNQINDRFNKYSFVSNNNTITVFDNWLSFRKYSDCIKY